MGHQILQNAEASRRQVMWKIIVFFVFLSSRSLKVHLSKHWLLKDLQAFALTCKCGYHLDLKWLNLPFSLILTWMFQNYSRGDETDLQVASTCKLTWTPCNNQSFNGWMKQTKHIIQRWYNLSPSTTKISFVVTSPSGQAKEANYSMDLRRFTVDFEPQTDYSVILLSVANISLCKNL